MAEEIFKDIIRKKRLDDNEWIIYSAGCWAWEGYPATKNAILTMKSRGIDLENHRSQPVTEILMEKMDLVLCMEFSHKDFLSRHFPDYTENIFLLSEMVGVLEDIDDPVNDPIQTYQESAEKLENLLNEGFDLIEILTRP